MTDKIFRQLGTGRMYVATPELAKRKDMQDYDPEAARIRKEAKLRRKEELLVELQGGLTPIVTNDQAKESLELATLEKEVADLEAKVTAKAAGLKEEEPAKTDAEQEAAKRQEIIDKDPEIIKIKAMKKIKDVTGYVEEEYGEILDKAIKLVPAKERAIELRTKRLFEV